MATQPPLVQLRNVRKRLGNVAALDGITVSFDADQVVGLIGPNGAGKSTLLRCLAGHLRLDQGSISLGGQEYNPKNPAAARARGVRLVEQELALFPSLSVAQNWRLLTGEVLGTIDRSSGILSDLNPVEKAGALAAASAQRLLLAAALHGGARILMFDEPTALLDARSATTFMENLTRSKGDRTCLVATHRLGDLAHLDRWLFLRNGCIVRDTCTWGEAKDFFLSSAGEKLVSANSPCTEVTRIFATEMGTSTYPRYTFPIRGGRILGLTASSGLPLFALARGLVQELRAKHVSVSYLGPERQADHMFSSFTVQEHIKLAIRDTEKGSSGRLAKHLEAFGLELTEPLRALPIRSLSGGMQQKLFLAIASARATEVRILCDPLRGVDLVSAGAVVEQLGAMRTTGDAIVVVTQDAELLLDCCDSIVVMSPHAEPSLIFPRDIEARRDLVRHL